MSEEYFSVELPLRVQDFSTILLVTNVDEMVTSFLTNSTGGWEGKFDSINGKGGHSLKKTKVGFVYICYGKKFHKEDSFFVILNTEGHISPILDRREIIEHFKFVEAENETEKV